jgi:arsenate reductase (glutaredoxin)
MNDQSLASLRRMLTIYHNPKCSTSKKVLALLEDEGVDHEVVLYLKQPPTRSELNAIVGKLEDPPADLVRNDPNFKRLGLDKADYTTKKAVVDLLVDHPELMQRPLLVSDAGAIIGRPVDRVTGFVA